MLHTSTHPRLSLFEGEIERFHQFAKMRSTEDGVALRRGYARYQRSWPLLIAVRDNGCLHEYSAALYDASQHGVGFICEQSFQIDRLIYIKLFWHDAEAIPIPSVVRHISPTASGMLVGSEYALSDWEACESALTMR